MQDFNFLLQNLRMMEDESIQDYHLNILDIVNAFDSLGEKISDEKLVRKILRSLPKRFDKKVIVIEEAQNISSLKVNELIGSLQNLELNINNKTDKKDKGIAFASNVDTKETQGNHEDKDSLSENIVVHGKQFRKILKQVDSRPRSNVQNFMSNIDNQPGYVKNTRNDEKNTQSKGVQCHEREEFGHIRTECATYLKKQKQSLIVSWSDVDSKGEVENESSKNVTALTGRYMSDLESCDEDLTYEELVVSYKDLYNKSEKFQVTRKAKEGDQSIAG